MILALKSLFDKKKYKVSPLALRSFNLKYSNAKQILWQQVDVFQWQVNFVLNKEQYSALFNSQGKWMETVSLVTFDKTPELIKQKFEEKFNRDGILHIHHVQTPENSRYEMNWHNGIYGIKLNYDIKGNIVGRIIL
jgi:hypothetical protein